MRSLRLVALAAVGVTAVACAGNDDGSTIAPAADASTGGDADASVDAATGPVDAAADLALPTGPCYTTFRFVPPTGTTPATVSASGEWNSFANPGTSMTGPDGSGAFTAKV